MFPWKIQVGAESSGKVHFGGDQDFAAAWNPPMTLALVKIVQERVRMSEDSTYAESCGLLFGLLKI